MFRINYSKRLIKAAKKDDLEGVKEAILNGANLNAHYEDSLTPLMYAAANNNLNIIEELISNGADLEFKDDRGYTALAIAVRRTNIKAIKVLIDKGANINASDGYEATVLINAVWVENLKVINLLLKNNALIDSKRKDGRTALMQAAHFGNANIAAVLLDNGADVNIKCNSYYTALMYAEKNKKFGTLRIIQDYIDKKTKLEKNSAPIQELWRKMGDERISFIGTYPKLGREITEIFNFNSRQQIITIENTNTNKISSPVVVKFRDIDQSTIEKAISEFKKQGGRIDNDFAIYSKSIIRKPRL